MSTEAQGRADDFWSRPEMVRRFAGRDPDLRLMELLRTWPSEAALRVLDLGCAGGRNTEALARAGADVHALDRSGPMVAHTRSRVAEIIGAAEAERRVGEGVISDLSRFEAGRFDLVVALGVYDSSTDRALFDRALSETARVLVPGGRALVATFSPGSQPEGRPLVPVPDERDAYVWRDGRRAVLLEPYQLDAAMAAHHLEPDVPTVTVRVPMDPGFRITINALYRKTGKG